MRAYEMELPVGYTEEEHVCFEEVRTGFLYDLKAVWPGLALIVIGCICVKPTFQQSIFSVLAVVLGIYPYFVLHELVHTAVYKAATGQKVRIRIVKSGGDCSMPDVYVYRTVAVICTGAPLVVFSVLLGGWTILAVLAGRWHFLPAGALMTLHLMGCRSDVHLLREIGKYKEKDILVRDSGSEQWIYRK